MGTEGQKEVDGNWEVCMCRYLMKGTAKDVGIIAGMVGEHDHSLTA